MDNQLPQVNPPQEPQQPAVQPQPVMQVPQSAPQVPQPVSPAAQPVAAAPIETTFSSTPAEQAQAAPDASITWSAEEYIHPDKTPIWYFLFGFIVLGFVAIDIFLLKSWTFSALMIVMAVATIVYIRRPARTLTYALSASQGLYVGQELHPFENFKSFGLIDADGSNSIMLMPVKRFSPGVSVYFPEEAGEQIVDILSSRLPMEELKLDIFDIIVRKLRL